MSAPNLDAEVSIHRNVESAVGRFERGIQQCTDSESEIRAARGSIVQVQLQLLQELLIREHIVTPASFKVFIDHYQCPEELADEQVPRIIQEAINCLHLHPRIQNKLVCEAVGSIRPPCVC
jgi:hypothetical protein